MKFVLETKLDSDGQVHQRLNAASTRVLKNALDLLGFLDGDNVPVSKAVRENVEGALNSLSELANDLCDMEGDNAETEDTSAV